jgi:hypothetical protein
VSGRLLHIGFQIAVLANVLFARAGSPRIVAARLINACGTPHASLNDAWYFHADRDEPDDQYRVHLGEAIAVR